MGHKAASMAKSARFEDDVFAGGWTVPVDLNGVTCGSTDNASQGIIILGIVCNRFLLIYRRL
jgi:hypothetical protein